jgi:hypothetical protein
MSSSSTLGQTVILALIGAYKAVMVVWGVVIAVQSRVVKIDKFKERQQLGYAIYNVTVMSAIILPISLLFNKQYGVAYMIRCIGIILVVAINIGILYIPKIFMIYNPEVKEARASTFASGLTKTSLVRGNTTLLTASMKLASSCEDSSISLERLPSLPPSYSSGGNFKDVSKKQSLMTYDPRTGVFLPADIKVDNGKRMGVPQSPQGEGDAPKIPGSSHDSPDGFIRSSLSPVVDEGKGSANLLDSSSVGSVDLNVEVFTSLSSTDSPQE